MNKSFQAVVDWYKPIVKLTHKQQVMRLYRNCLRNLTSWTENRELFNVEATKIRLQFNANMNLDAASPKVAELLKDAEKQLAEQFHPDPYIVPFMPGGTLFMRNPAIPLEALYPDGIPAGMSRRRVNIDFSNIPDDQPYANKVFVDSANKKYWIDK